jgi:hypothetical protein
MNVKFVYHRMHSLFSYPLKQNYTKIKLHKFEQIKQKYTRFNKFMQDQVILNKMKQDQTQ